MNNKRDRGFELEIFLGQGHIPSVKILQRYLADLSSM